MGFCLQTSGMFGQTDEADPARIQMNEEQDVVGGETAPGEHFDGEGFGDTGDLLKGSPSEPLADFSEGRSLGIRKA